MDAEDGRICADDQARRDDQAWIATLYREHAEGLRCLLLGLLRNRADADESLQHVFLKLLESSDTVDPSTAKGWLYTVAYHEALARRRRKQVGDVALTRLSSRPAWHGGGEPDDPTQACERTDQREAVRRAVSALPETQREIVERRMYRDQTFSTIAREINCPLNTVLSRMRLAMEKLKPFLEPWL